MTATVPEHPGPTDAGILAKAALRQGQDAVSRADSVAARRWFDRARRLAPGNDAAALCLASACLGHDDARAVELFDEVLTRHDVRAAWLGLALARLRLRQPGPAAAALAAALGRFVIRPQDEIAAIAERVVQATGWPGWCGLGPGGALQIGGDGPVQVELDGALLKVRNGRLPAGWQSSKHLDIHLEGRRLLGSPIDLVAITRIEGCVWTAEGELEGWAWQPADPEADPLLHLLGTAAKAGRRGQAGCIPIRATDLEATIADTAVLARPRRFRVPVEALHGLDGLVSVIGPDGRHLSGSPLDPGAERRDAIAAARAVAVRFSVNDAPSRGVARRNPADVVVPVHGGGAVTLDCLDAVLASLPQGSRLVVVDDASPDPELVEALDALARKRLIRLIRHERNRGFPASANAGLRACAGRDVVLLNSDTLVPPGWLERLREAAYVEADIGSVTPLSNDASILSYPGPAGTNPVPSMQQTLRLDRLAAAANAGVRIDIPTAVGFCMYIRRECLQAVGGLREDLFAQGYGEENDFCVRASHLGWRHVAAPGIFVGHRTGQSFGPARVHLLARNAAVLDRLHPGYLPRVVAHGLADPLAEARRRIDAARWRAGRRRGAGSASVILITHFHGGGTERQIGVHCEAVRRAGQRPIVLRPARLPDGSAAVMVGDGVATDYPNLRYALPAELPGLVRLLAGDRPVAAQLHHLLGHDYDVLQVIEKLGIPYEVHVHDSAAFCPRVGLLGPDRRYCGEPEIRHCEACIADIGRKDGLDIPVAELRRRSAGILGRARRVVVPSSDTGARIRRHFPSVETAIVEHGDDETIADPAPPRGVRQDGTGRLICRAAVIGAIGLEKGFEVLLACARDAAWRDLPLEFVVVGHTIDDSRLQATGRVFVTGEYQAEEAVELIRAQHASLALISSIWPETWCFTLTEAWQAGLRAVCFDIGAPAERIRRTGRGVVLPLNLSAGATNHAIISACGLAREVAG